jgi:hypothetical protein
MGVKFNLKINVITSKQRKININGQGKLEVENMGWK